jgi:hypothetical protein
METIVSFAVLFAVVAFSSAYTEALLKVSAAGLLKLPAVLVLAAGGALGGYLLEGPMIAVAAGLGTIGALHIMSVVMHAVRNTAAWQQSQVEARKESYAAFVSAVVSEARKLKQ